MSPSLLVPRSVLPRRTRPNNSSKMAPEIDVEVDVDVDADTADTTTTTTTTTPARDMLSLPAEILLNILAHLDPTLEIPRIDDRAWLSVESFKMPPPRDDGATSYVANFRLTCRKFSEVGIHHQFKRVVTRFSVKGFTRLENIAAQPRIARVVQKFSYMVPRVYLKDQHRIRALQTAADDETNQVTLRRFFDKAREQADIVHQTLDKRALEAAIASFERLQHIRVLRVEDSLDAAFLAYLNNHREVAEQQDVELEWGPVSLRAAGALGDAVLRKKSPASRWSFPLIDTQSAIALMNRANMGISSIAASLECLSLRFEDAGDLNAKMRELSPHFRTVFTSATNLVSVHIGFPHASVNIALADIFHGIKLAKLRVFSIGGWRLNAQEIMDLGHGYGADLRGLRLHGVLLKEGGMWTEVLSVLRREMANLRWLSLSKADYAKHFDDHARGMDVTGHHDMDDSDPEGDADDDEHYEPDEAQDAEDQDLDDLSSNEDDPEPDSDVDSVDDLNPTAHAFTTQVDVPEYEHVCTCSHPSHLLDVEDLGDNGVSVSQVQRKLWERWVVGCLVHGRPRSSVMSPSRAKR